MKIKSSVHRTPPRIAPGKDSLAAAYNGLVGARRAMAANDAAAFNPADWLAAWSAAGGAVVTRGDELFLCSPMVDVDIAQEFQRIELQHQLIGARGKEALLAHLRRPFDVELQS